MNVKAAFTGKDRHSILESCEYGEDAAQKAYKSAATSSKLPGYLKEMISKQQNSLKNAHDEVKAMRDTTK